MRQPLDTNWSLVPFLQHPIASNVSWQHLLLNTVYSNSWLTLQPVRMCSTAAHSTGVCYIASYSALLAQTTSSAHSRRAVFLTPTNMVLAYSPGGASPHCFSARTILLHITNKRYGLRPRVHDRTLPERSSNLVDCIIRMLYMNEYWLNNELFYVTSMLCFTLLYCMSQHCVSKCVMSFCVLNDYWLTDWGFIVSSNKRCQSTEENTQHWHQPVDWPNSLYKIDSDKLYKKCRKKL